MCVRFLMQQQVRTARSKEIFLQHTHTHLGFLLITHGIFMRELESALCRAKICPQQWTNKLKFNNSQTIIYKCFWVSLQKYCLFSRQSTEGLLFSLFFFITFCRSKEVGRSCRQKYTSFVSHRNRQKATKMSSLFSLASLYLFSVTQGRSLLEDKCSKQECLKIKSSKHENLKTQKFQNSKIPKTKILRLSGNS